MPWLPRHQFLEFPKLPEQGLPTQEIIKLYESGFAGCKRDDEAQEKFLASLTWPDGEMAAQEFGIADTGQGKLVIPFVFVLEYYANCWPGRQGQARGDCVSWSTRNTALLTMCCDIASGKPDEKSGKPEEAPEVPADGIADGVLSTEAIYWYRGYNGDGWHCGTASNVAMTKGGIVLRKNYPDLGFDLTTYSGQKAGLYGARAPGANIQDMTDDHLIHQVTEVRTAEACRDFLFNGYGISSCGGEGLSNQRDENGVSKRQGSWAHAMAYIGFDDRPTTHQKYGGPLILDLNSWAKWNSGPRDIYDSAQYVPAHKKDEWVRKGIVNASTGNVMIPEGSCWVRWSEFRNREMQAYSGVNGWPRKVLPLPWIF